MRQETPDPARFDAEALEIEALRRMTPDAKLAVMRALIRQAYALKCAGLRALHPELSEEEAWARARELVGGGRP